MKRFTFPAIACAIAAIVLTPRVALAQFDFNYHAAAEAHDQIKIANLGPYRAESAKTESNPQFYDIYSVAAEVDGRDSEGLLKAQALVDDDEPYVSVTRGARAYWQDRVFVDNGVVNSNDPITIVLGVNGTLSVDADDDQPGNAYVSVGVDDDYGFGGITDSRPGNNVSANAWAQDYGTYPWYDNAWDGDLLLPQFETPTEAGWETFASTINRDSGAMSFTASFEGTFAVELAESGYNGDRDQFEYDLKIVLSAGGEIDSGIFDADAGSSLDILGFRTPDGEMIATDSFDLESGMTVIPEPATALMLGVGGGLVMLRRRRA